MSKKKEQEEPTQEDALTLALKAIDKTYGKGTVIMGDVESVPGIEFFSSGCFSIDKALGGGWARGRIIEVLAPESSGKTSICLHAIAEIQKEGGKAAFIDVEHAFDPEYAKQIGVNLNQLIFSQPDSGEQALNVADMLIRTGALSLLVIDSVAALVPAKELEGDVGDSVTFDTPIFIRNKTDQNIDIISIAELHHVKNYAVGHNTCWYKKFKRIETLTHQGWKPLLGVVKKKNWQNKDIVCTRTSTGYVQTTKDHSLFVEGKEIKPTEIQLNDRLDIYSPLQDTKDFYNSKHFIPPGIAWILGFWVAEGSTPTTYSKNIFEVSNTNIELISQCQSILDLHFMGLTKIRKQTTLDNRKDLYILTCSANKELGDLLRSCLMPQTMLKKVPKFILNGCAENKQAFLSGFWEGDGSSTGKTVESKHYHNNSLAVIAGIQFLNSCLGIRTNVSIHPSRPEQVTLRENTQKVNRRENEVLQFYNRPAPEELWDISTEAGTFVNAIGNIVCHNSVMGLQARMMSQAMRKLCGIAHNTNTTVMFTNQIRMKFVMFGSPEVGSGGQALKFYASQRVDLRRIGGEKEGDTLIANKTRLKVIKNKVAPPFREAEFLIRYGVGIDKFQDTIAMGLSSGVIERAGPMYIFLNEKHKGIAAFTKYLSDNPNIYQELQDKINGN